MYEHVRASISLVIGYYWRTKFICSRKNKIDKKMEVFLIRWFSLKMFNQVRKNKMKPVFLLWLKCMYAFKNDLIFLSYSYEARAIIWLELSIQLKYDFIKYSRLMFYLVYNFCFGPPMILYASKWLSEKDIFLPRTY